MAKNIMGKDGNINFDALESTMKNAVEADAKYWRENDAKMRAVEQRVATYEEFEGIVKGAHIKPMTEDITQLNLKKSSWVGSGRAKERARKEQTAELEQHDATDDWPEPKNVQMFLRTWRKLESSSIRYRYLLYLGSTKLESLFKPEIGHGLLGEFAIALLEGFEDEDVESILAIMVSLSKANRFSLTVDFLSDKEREAANSLLAKLPENTNTDDLRKQFS